MSAIKTKLKNKRFIINFIVNYNIQYETKIR